VSGRRRFNGGERVALYLAAGGRCEGCGSELRPGWHADHVHPWAEGGPTDVTNGAALCPACNLKKGTTIMTDPRDRWQADAVERFLATGTDFLVTACPGAGKTRMALKAARALVDDGTVDRVVVVAPTKAVRSQWAREARRFGLDLTQRYQNGDGALPKDAHGVVTVYQAVARQPLAWRMIASRAHRTLVVLDEIHHAADADHTTWGPALLEAFSAATRRLLLSGTPFRTDGTRIPFVTYDDTGTAVAHAGLSYGDAVSLGVVRPVRFEVMNGAGEWLKGDRRAAAFAASVAEADEPALLTSLYSALGNWIPSVMRRADEELSRLREEMPSAGGLVVAEDRARAREYAVLLERVCGERVDLVISDDPDAGEDPAALIDSYRRSGSRWIVAVDLISEGVDIPRLGVVLFASRKRTEMWFRQIVGRCVRRDGDDVTATVFIPALPVLVDMAERIETEADAGLRAAERGLRDRMRNEQRTLEFEVVQPLGSSDAVLDRVITGGDAFGDDELARARDVQTAVGGSLAVAHLGDIAKALRLVTGTVPVATIPVVLDPPEATGDELRSVLRRQVNVAVNRLSRDREIHQGKIHAQLNRTFGDTLPTASADTLHKRLEVLRTWP